MKTAQLLFIPVVLLALSSLSGCAVYGPPVAYEQQPYYQTVPAYTQPPPVYVVPQPVYVQPPVSFGFNFGYWGGGRRYGGYHHGFHH